MAERTITYDDYLRLRGLFTLAADTYRERTLLEHAAAGVLGEEKDERMGDYGLLSDALYEGTADVDALLRNMEIKVEPGPDLSQEAT